MRTGHSLLRLVSILLDLVQDALQFLLSGTRSSVAFKAENIFLRKQLALYMEREAKPRRATGATRLSSTLAAFCMAECLDQRQAGDIPRPASEGFSVALAIESRPRGKPRLSEEVLTEWPGHRRQYLDGRTR
jgi:putative transposase